MEKFIDFITEAVESAVVDRRSKKNLRELLLKMKTEQRIQIWTLSSDKAEYERFDTLLSNDKSRNTLNRDTFNELLELTAREQIVGQPSATVIHDPCSIRKMYSEKLEKIDRVRDLDGQMINGYRTFNSVLLYDSKISLLGCTPYSRKEASEDGVGHLTTKEVGFAQIRSISKTLKADFADRRITHLFDREADDLEYFELIDKELEDLFIFRMKSNRNSDVAYWNDEKDKEFQVKLHSKPLANSFHYVFEKFVYKGKCHHQIHAKISYEKHYIGCDYYNVVKIELTYPSGKALFKKPMVLVTNYDIPNGEVALFVFQKYLKRSKIEGVFKFLKEKLGWEEFRVRNLQAIKNVLLLGFFVGAYFYEYEAELVDNPLVIVICKLAKSKGKISRHFFMEGLIVLAHWQLAQQFFKEHDIPPEKLEELMAFLE